MTKLKALLTIGAAVPVAAWPCIAGAQGFNDITASSGVEFDHSAVNLPMPIGAGAAWTDVDGDGDDDFYAVNGSDCNVLFLNDGAGNFSAVPDAAGASACADASQSVSSADMDNDGDQDLHIGNFGQNRLFKNLLVETGSLAFEDATAAAGLDNDGERNTASTVWGDYNKDGFLDLYAGSHVGGPGTTPPDPPEPGPPPGCFEDYLWRNNGDGTFTDVGADTGIDRSGVLDKPGCQLASTWSDYDNDGDLDLMVVNDFGTVRQVPNRLFRNDGSDGQGGWIFTDISESSGFDYDQAGMGIAIGDLNRDGLFDYYMSDAGINELGVNNGDDTFTESAGQLGVEAYDIEIYGGLGLVSWGNGFFDLDLDSWEDLIVCNGGAPQDLYPGFFEGEDYIQNNPCYVYRNRWPTQGVFVEQHAQLGVSHARYYRSVAVSDIDDDGDVDMYFGNLHGFGTLWENVLGDASPNNWLKVKTVGTLGNRDGIGARIEAKAAGVTLMREISGGASFMSSHSMTAHFGLKGATSSDVKVTFLSGVEQELLFVDSKQTIEVTEPLVSASFPAEVRLVTEGSAVGANIRLENHTDVEQTRLLWVAAVTADGETPVASATLQVLAPDEVRFVPTLITVAAPAGVTKYGTRLGIAGAGITHRDHLTVVGQAPAQ